MNTNTQGLLKGNGREINFEDLAWKWKYFDSSPLDKGLRAEEPQKTTSL